MAKTTIWGDPDLTRQKTAAETEGYPLTEEDSAWVDSVYEKLTVKMKTEAQRIGTMIPYTPGP